MPLELLQGHFCCACAARRNHLAADVHRDKASILILAPTIAQAVAVLIFSPATQPVVDNSYA